MSIETGKAAQINTSVGFDDGQMSETRQERAVNLKPVKKEISPAEAIEAVRRTHDRILGNNSWSEGFHNSLLYPNGVTKDDVASLDHFSKLRLQQKMAEAGTIEVTSDLLEGATCAIRLRTSG